MNAHIRRPLHRPLRWLPHTALAAACASLLPLPAHAQLDGTMPLTADAQGDAPVPLLNGAVLMRTRIDAGGTTIHEYASGTGRIFAYTWQGPTMPDLRTLLGTREQAYLTGAANRLAGAADLHAARIAGPDVVVESGGQMRSYVGRAWLTDALPAGVTPDDLQ